MTLVGAFFRRDLRLALSRPGGFLLDAISAFLAPMVMYFLGRSANATSHLFPFVMAGLLALRLHAIIIRTTENVSRELITGTFELIASSSWPDAVTATAILGFEVARALALTVAMYAVSIVVLGAPGPSHMSAIAALPLGLFFGVFVFAGLALLIVGLVMVVRLSRALSGLFSIVLPIIAGAYFPVGLLPSPIDSIVGALPFRRVTDLLRNAVLNRPLNAGGVPVLAAETVLLLGGGLLVYRWGLSYARRHGTLGTE